MKKVADLKKEMVNKTFTDAEIDAVMFDAGYVPFDTDLTDGVIAVFTDSKRLIYVKGFRNIDGDAEVVDITQNNNINNGDQTKVEPFHTYEDLEAVFNYFKGHGQWNHWLACRLMVGLGRRSGDTLNLRWCDLFKDKECTKFYDRCMKLKEEKTRNISRKLESIRLPNMFSQFSMSKLPPSGQPLRKRLRLLESIILSVSTVSAKHTATGHTRSIAMREFAWKSSVACLGIPIQESLVCISTRQMRMPRDTPTTCPIIFSKKRMERRWRLTIPQT